MTVFNANLKMGVSRKIPLINFFVRTHIRRMEIGDNGGGNLNKESKILGFGFPLDMHSLCF